MMTFMAYKNIIIFIALFFVAVFFSCSSEQKSSETTDDDRGITETPDDTDFNDSDEPADIHDDDIISDNGNFEKGPYGFSFGDTAGDFTLPLESGDWKFSENRSSLENYIFIFYRPSNSESRTIWQTDLIRMFDNTPENTYYFFLVEGTEEIFAQRTEQLKNNIRNAVQISGKPGIMNKVHVVSKPVDNFESWFSDWLKRYPDFFLGIDRFQKIRYGGSFHSWQSSTFDPKLEFIYKEAELYNFEHYLSQALEQNKERSVIIKGVDGETFPEEGWVKDIYFEAEFPKLAEHGKLYIYLEQICISQKDCEWDRLQHLYLCDNDDPDKCDIEIGRWITTYGRSGKWLTDISSFLPLFKNSGKYKFRFTVTGDNYINYLDLIFVEDEEAPVPSELIPLYSGTTQFNESYNDKFDKIEVAIPENFDKVIISAYITGHGNGSETENCAEFCKFESIFYVNDVPFSTKFDNAGTSLGCFNKVTKGVVPNQYGSWPFGRAGWCPGQDVKPINIDITEHVNPGEKNTIFFQSFLRGENYIPEVTDPSGYRAEIPLSSYIVLWK